MKMKTLKKLSWKPVSRGEIYCAPACGRGCTRKEYDAAMREAVKLVARLGPGWKPVLTENLGWFWRVQSANISVSQFGKKFTAWIHELNGPGIVWSGDGRTPHEAVRSALRVGRTFARHTYQIVAKAEKVRLA